MIDLYYTEKRFVAVAQAWDELEDWQMEELADAMYQPGAEYAARVSLCLLGAVKNQQLQLSLAKRQLTHKGRMAVGDFLRRVLEGYSGFLLENTRKKQLRTIEVNEQTWIGPGDGLKLLTFGEFIFTESLAKSYHLTKDRKYLEQLVAVLYLPSTIYEGKKRQKFDQEELEERASLLNTLPLKRLQATLLFYTGCVNSLGAQFSEVMEGEKDEEGNKKIKRKATSITGNDWLDVLLKQTGSLIDVNAERWKSTLLVEVLLELQSRIREHKRKKK